MVKQRFVFWKEFLKQKRNSNHTVILDEYSDFQDEFQMIHRGKDKKECLYELWVVS